MVDLLNNAMNFVFVVGILIAGHFVCRALSVWKEDYKDTEKHTF